MALAGSKTDGRWTRRALVALAATLVVLLAPLQAVAQDSRKGRIDVRSAYTEFQDGVFFLSARVEYRLSRQALEALNKGVALNAELQINLVQMRRFIWDAGVANLRQRYQLSFHALTQRFVVLNINSGESESFADLESALANLGTIERLPIIDAALLDRNDNYEIALRSVLDIKELPASVRLLSLVWGDWRVASDWYTWRLKP